MSDGAARCELSIRLLAAAEGETMSDNSRARRGTATLAAALMLLGAVACSGYDGGAEGGDQQQQQEQDGGDGQGTDSGDGGY